MVCHKCNKCCNTKKKMQKPRSIDSICRPRSDCCNHGYVGHHTSISRCCVDNRDHYAHEDYESGACSGSSHHDCSHDHHNNCHNDCHYDCHDNCYQDHHDYSCDDHYHNDCHSNSSCANGQGSSSPSTNCLPENFTGDVLSFTDSTIPGSNFLAYKIPTLDSDTVSFDVQVFRTKDTVDHPIPSGNYAEDVKIAILEILSPTSFKVIQINNLDDILSSSTTTLTSSSITYTMKTYVTSQIHTHGKDYALGVWWPEPPSSGNILEGIIDEPSLEVYFYDNGTSIPENLLSAPTINSTYSLALTTGTQPNKLYFKYCQQK